MCYFLIKVLLVLSANFKTLVDANAESRVPERNTECLWEPEGHFSLRLPFFTRVIQPAGDSRFVFRLYSTGLAVTFSLSVAEIQHRAATYHKQKK